MKSEIHTRMIAQHPSIKSKWATQANSRAFLHPNAGIEMEILLGGKQRRSRFLPSRQTGCSSEASRSNPLAICDLLKKRSCGWSYCDESPKCKGRVSKDHG